MIINNKINFGADEENYNHKRESEVFMPSIPLKKGKYSDTGYRFRRNHYEIDKHWLGNSVEEKLFYDTFHFNTDVFDNSNPDDTTIAELFFRQDGN